MEANLYNLFYLFFRLSPFIVACFFSLISIFNSDMKGLIYLVGLIFTTAITWIFGRSIITPKNMDMMANGNSVYFIHNLIKHYHNLTLLKIRPINSESARLTESVDFFSYMFKISYGIVDFSKYLTPSKLKMLNHIFITNGFLPNKYLLRKSYVNIHSDRLLNIFSLYEPDTPEKMDFVNEISEILFEIIDPRVEMDNPIILIKTDYDFI